jgi:hypothetical protein
MEQLKGRLRLTDPQRQTLAEIGYRLGRKALADVANVVKPDTILGWYRKLVAQSFDGSKARASVGRPRISQEAEALIVRMARENPGWGYDRIAGALRNLGHTVADQTIGNVLRRHDIPTAPERKTKTTWAEFIRSPQGGAGRDRLLERGGFDAAWIGHLLHPVFHTHRDSPCRGGRHHSAPR